MVRFSKSSWILLGSIGTLWYITLVVLIVSCSEYPGSELLHDYSWPIFAIFLGLTACFRQAYVIKKRESKEVD